MNLSQISSSQFADTCNIPRPTVSQILNGRNKKISDEIIGKIHSSFPSLSMLWLMFGEGDMLINQNIETTVSKTQQNLDNLASQTAENNFFTTSLGLNFDCTENISENSDLISNGTIEKIEKSSKEINTNKTKQLSFTPDTNKTIVNIMVFYSDNSFESFTPTHNKI